MILTRVNRARVLCRIIVIIQVEVFTMFIILLNEVIIQLRIYLQLINY